MTTPEDPRWSPDDSPGEPQWTPPPPQPVKGRARGKTVALGAAAVIVLGGGVATYAALSSGSGAGGSATPTAAVQKIFQDMNNSDLLGMLDDLPPGERAALVKPFQDSVTQLERIGVLQSGTNLNHISGIHIHASNLTFAPQAVSINDHVRVVKLTGGTITVDANAAQLPLAGNLLRALQAHTNGPTRVHHTINIGAAVRRQGKPIRIATQQVDGQWYPSLLYTVADNVTTSAGLGTPNPADAIPARGASSPDQAVRGMLTDLLGGRVEQAIELTSPDEDAVLHDYGSMIVSRVHYPPAPFRINHITFTDTPIDGGTQVNLKSVTATVSGHQVSVSVNGNCVDFTGIGQHRKMCGGQLAGMLNAAPIPAGERVLLTDLSSGFKKIGIATSSSGGKWYVNPLRTLEDIGPILLSGLTANDFHALLHGGMMGGPMGLMGGPMGLMGGTVVSSGSAHGGMIYHVGHHVMRIPRAALSSSATP